MPTLLQIDSSPRSASVSSALAARYVANWKQKHSDGKVIHHNTTLEKLPYVDEVLLSAMFSPAETLNADQKAILGQSDRLCDELIAADVLLLSVPMWNLGVPASFKSWVDLVSRAGKTFRYTSTGVETLLAPGKKAIVVSSRGGAYTAGSPAHAWDQVEPYLRTILGFLGISDVTFVFADNQSRSGDAPALGVATAEKQIDALPIA